MNIFYKSFIFFFADTCKMRVKNIMIILLILWPIIYIHSIDKSLFVYNNKIGNLQLSNEYWRIQYTLDIHDYLETADLLDNYTNKLSEACEGMKSPLCDVFIAKSRRFIKKVNADVFNFHIMKRTKRFIPLLIIAGVSTMAIIASMAANKMALKTLANELGNNIDSMRYTLNMTQESFELQKDMINDLDEKIDGIGNKLNEYIISTDKFKTQSSIILLMLFLLREHDDMHDKLHNFFLGNHREKIFSIIDFIEFNNVVDSINANLSTSRDNEFMLPKFLDQNSTDLIKISYENSENRLIINLDIPVLSGEKYTLFEALPIPNKNWGIKDSLNILDFNSYLYVELGKEHFVLEEDDLYHFCTHTLDLTVCDGQLKQMFQPPSGCMGELLFKDSIENCIFKPIKYDNYLIRITDTILFAFVVHL